MEEKLIKALSSLTGIKESKLNKLETDILYDIINKPNIIEPIGNRQLEKINLLNELIVNLDITKDFRYKSKITLSNSYEAKKYFKHLIGNKKDKEVFFMAMFDKNDNLIKIKKMSEGTINYSYVYPREIVKEILKTKCRSVIFCHNHPSGIAKPSPEDIELTQNYKNILEPLKINIKDHIIVGNDSFSFLENNLLDYSKTYKIKASEEEDIYNQKNNYYMEHLNNYLKALISLTGINKEKINNYIEKEINKRNDTNLRNDIALEIIEEPQKMASKLGLSSSERKKLENLNQFIYNKKLLKRNDMVAITEPYQMYCQYLQYEMKNRVQDNNLYMMLFDTKLRVIGFENLSYMEGDDIIYNPKDILTKSLAYEANAVSLIMKSKGLGFYFRNKIMETLEGISQNTVNMLNQLGIKLLDVLYISGDKYESLKSIECLPDTSVGKPCYEKTKILESVRKYSIENEIIDAEEEEEWEIEV